MRVIEFDDLRDRPGGVGRFQGADYGASTSFFIVSSKPGKGAARHRHPYEEIFVILAGMIEVEVGNEKGIFGPGHVVVIPPNTWHGFVNRSAFSASMVNIHSSPEMIQEDWDEQVHGPR